MVSPGIRHCVYLSPSGVCRKVSRCSVLVGMSGHFLSVLDAAARLVFSVRCSEHITPLLHDLHWLRVEERIRFRLLCSDILLFERHGPGVPRGRHPASAERPTSTAVVTSARRQRRLSSSRPFVDPHSATGLSLSPLHRRRTVCHRPSELHRQVTTFRREVKRFLFNWLNFRY